MENIYIKDANNTILNIYKELFLVNDAITYCYKNLNSRDLEFTKDIFRRLHFYKLKKLY